MNTQTKWRNSAEKLREIAKVAKEERKRGPQVQSIVDRILKEAESAAKGGKFCCYIYLGEAHEILLADLVIEVLKEDHKFGVRWTPPSLLIVWEA